MQTAILQTTMLCVTAFWAAIDERAFRICETTTLWLRRGEIFTLLTPVVLAVLLSMATGVHVGVSMPFAQSAWRLVGFRRPLVRLSTPVTPPLSPSVFPAACYILRRTQGGSHIPKRFWTEVELPPCNVNTNTTLPFTNQVTVSMLTSASRCTFFRGASPIVVRAAAGGSGDAAGSDRFVSGRCVLEFEARRCT